MLLTRAPRQMMSLLRRRYRARQLHIPYTRSRDFRMPSEMWVAGTMRPIHAPHEGGATLAFSEIFLDDIYGTRHIRFPVRTVMDVGAHSGFFSLFARTRFPGAAIHAYEPNPAMHPFLRTQADTGSFKFFGEALGAMAGRVSVAAAEDSVATTVRRDDGGTVPMIPLASAIERLGGSVDLLKLDCEGSEWEMIQDADAFEHVRYLGMEYHLVDGRTLDELIATLGALGFRILFAERNDLKYGILRAVKRGL